MLFNSYAFIFVFLPIVLGFFYVLQSTGRQSESLYFLVLSSLFFYGYWNPVYICLILASIAFNYLIGLNLIKLHRSVPLLTVGIIFNLLLLIYFKYANFLVDNLKFFFTLNLELKQVVLPLAISFFTFQQIAYLADAYSGKVNGYRFRDYALFVLFFPQLIAGPIVHHSDILPQFKKRSEGKININVLIGISCFSIGLFKKVVFADGIAPYSTMVFDAATAGAQLTFFEAWCGALAYSFQIYFDFSGYSDMAIGLARMFGIVLPANFASPYKATSIVEFWRRWHMTLSRFLRDYLYIPLGGNRFGELGRVRNLMLTMLLGGVWHGAGWTFALWGVLHGVYLVINHLVQKISVFQKFRNPILSWFLTMLSVVIAWVIFRAESIESAIAVLRGMVGLNGIAFPETYLLKLDRFFNAGSFLSQLGITFTETPCFQGITEVTALLFLLAVIVSWPNTQEVMSLWNPVLGLQDASDNYFGSYRYQLKLNIVWGFIIGIVFIAAIVTMQQASSEFLYFQF